MPSSQIRIEATNVQILNQVKSIYVIILWNNLASDWFKWYNTNHHQFLCVQAGGSLYIIFFKTQNEG